MFFERLEDSMRIISREAWGARPPKRRYMIATPTRELWLHHSAGGILPGDNSVSDADLRRIKSIQNYHMDNRGWSDIAYSFLLDPDGNVFEGRGAGVAGGHTRGHNTHSHAICVMGNYNNQSVDDDLLPRIAEFVVYGYQRNWWPQDFTGGHRDASGSATSCPGVNLYAELDTISELIKEVTILTSEQEAALNYLVAALESDNTDTPPWGAGVWNDYKELWGVFAPGPLGPVSHLQMAWLYDKLKKLAEGDKAFQAAIAVHAANPDAHHE